MPTSSAITAVTMAFFASCVEVVEAFTIVLAIAVTRGWRPALSGTVVALAVLTLMVLVLGPLLPLLPMTLLHLVIGTMLLLFGLGWLCKSILRSAGIIPLHDEDAVFEATRGEWAPRGDPRRTSLNVLGGIIAFKAVLLEGLEVVFIVVAIGVGHDLLAPAAIGALTACLLAAGAILRHPLSRIPENTLKQLVGVVSAAFGVLWTGKGLGIEWPGDGDLALLVFIILFFATARLTIHLLRRSFPEVAGR
ncbi:COG4280 domain-containing protein [Niveispirillum sp. KHB5.9]|uniref:COG4280 domain-containing protein n=1 Tax=Niveispirillum sp. KHB5.9 TaxID=3400269 RepID=UPI003A893548